MSADLYFCNREVLFSHFTRVYTNVDKNIPQCCLFLIKHHLSKDNAIITIWKWLFIFIVFSLLRSYIINWWVVICCQNGSKHETRALYILSIPTILFYQYMAKSKRLKINCINLSNFCWCIWLKVKSYIMDNYFLY